MPHPPPPAPGTNSAPPDVSPRMKPLPACPLLLIASVLSAPLEAQGLPVQLPRLPGQLGETVARTLDRATGTLRQVRIDQLLRRHRHELDRDHAGAPVVRGEVVAIDPSPEALASARAAGFRVLRERDAELTAMVGCPRADRARAALRSAALDRRANRLQHLYWEPKKPGRSLEMVQQFVVQDLRRGCATGRTVESGVLGPCSLAGRVHNWGCNGRRIPCAWHGRGLVAGAAKDGGCAAAGQGRVFAADILMRRAGRWGRDRLAQALAGCGRAGRGGNLSLVGPSNALRKKW